MSSNVFGIDLGSSNIKIYNKATGHILNEKNVIAIADKKRLLSYGDEAYEMHEKAPANISVSFPMFNGVIADYQNMQTLLLEFLKKSSKTKLRDSDFIIAVPTDITEVEKKAFHDLVKKSSLKPRDVLVAEKPVADAVGLGLDVNTPLGTMVVDIGADTTEISVLSLGGIVLSKLLKLGGNKFDESIINYIKKNHNLVIGQKTGRALKEKLGSAIKSENPSVKAFGRDIVTGLPIAMDIESELIYDAIKEHVKSIIDAMKLILERTPPELAADIIEHGIYLTGGGSQIHQFDELITDVTGLKVNCCEAPTESVVKGLMQIVTEEKYRSLAYAMKEKIFS